MISPAIWKSSLENDDCTYIYLRPSLALTLNIEHKYLYLRPSLATFNHMKIFFWEWRLYIYLRPSLALTINIWTLTLSHFINNFVSCFHPTPSSEYSSSGQRWIDTTLTDIFGLVCYIYTTPSSGNIRTTRCLLTPLCAEKHANIVPIWHFWVTVWERML